MKPDSTERVELARRLGAERMNLGIGISTPLNEFEFVALTTVYDEYDPAEGHVGPLRWYVTFFDASGCAIRNSFLDCESKGEALEAAMQIGVPEGKWTTALRVALLDDGSLPVELLARLRVSPLAARMHH